MCVYACTYVPTGTNGGFNDSPFEGSARKVGSGASRAANESSSE